MKISEYVKEYTAGGPIVFLNVVSEVNELFLEFIEFRKDGIKEEFGDVFHFLQLWLYSQFGIDGEVWRITKNSVKKFIDRKSVWNNIYISVGLPQNVSGYVGNYNKIEKVVGHLQNFGVSKETAEAVYRKIVMEKH